MSRTSFAFLLIVVLLLTWYCCAVVGVPARAAAAEGYTGAADPNSITHLVQVYGPIPVPARFSTLPPMPHPSYAVSALNPQLHPNIGVSEQGAYEASPSYA